MKSKNCELCNGEASVYCVSDSAFLCWKCDARVHEANFLVARHVRRTICCKCNGFDGNHISGIGSHLDQQSICRSCSSEVDDYETSSTCTSSCTVAKKLNSDHRNSVCDYPSSRVSLSKKKKQHQKMVVLDTKAEGILVNWYKRLGLRVKKSTIAVALHAFSICLKEFAILRYRVCLVSSFWISLKLDPEISTSAYGYLRKLEEITGVPCKLVVLVERKIAPVFEIKPKKEVDLEEGWAECSD